MLPGTLLDAKMMENYPKPVEKHLKIVFEKLQTSCRFATEFQKQFGRPSPKITHEIRALFAGQLQSQGETPQSAAVRESVFNPRFLLRKAFARFMTTNLPTPVLPAGCVGFCSHTRRPLHSPKFVELALRRGWPESGRFLPEACLKNGPAFAKANTTNR